MQFRTEIQLLPASFQIAHKDKIFSIGSCFADRIGEKLAAEKFEVCINPCGTIFNPLSIAKNLTHTFSEKVSERFVQRDGMWFSYDLHSSVNGKSKQELSEKISTIHQLSASRLRECRVLILTLGTAFVYSLQDGETVANCHKIPASNFKKDFLEVSEIVKSLKGALLEIKKRNVNLRVILTVSPVRHIKDTLTLNAVSKSALRLAAFQLENEMDFVEYFPAYEMMIDDLRDYRFYGEDMIHPTAFAEQYIFQKFIETYSSASIPLLEKWKALKKRMEHIVQNENTPEAKAFVKETLAGLKALNAKMNLNSEIEFYEHSNRHILNEPKVF